MKNRVGAGVAWLTAGLVTLATFGFSTTTRAHAPATEAIALTPIVTDGNVSAVGLERIRAGLRRGLAARGSDVIGVDAPPKSSTSADTCQSETCWAEKVRTSGAPHLVQLAVSLEGRDYRLEFMMVDAQGTSTRVTRQCEICGFDEVATMVHDQAVMLADKARVDPANATLIVRVKPTGALIEIDGAPMGNAPLTQSIEPGRHTVRASLAGYATSERELETIPAAQDTLNFRLQRLEAPRPRVYRVTGWSLLAAGVASTTSGAVLLALHHRPVDNLCQDPLDVDANGVCRWRYDLAAGGATLVALGAVGVITGTVLTILGTKGRARNRRASTAIGPRGVAFTLKY